MINPYSICYRCQKCGSLQIIGERVNFGTAEQDLDGKSVADAYRLASHSNVPQNILDAMNSDLRCKSCASLQSDLTVADIFVKRL